MKAQLQAVAGASAGIHELHGNTTEKVDGEEPAGSDKLHRLTNHKEEEEEEEEPAK